MTDPIEKKLLGKGVEIVDASNATADDILVCMPTGASPFGDNVECPCADCGITIMYRPHAPAAATKVCVSCGTRRIEAQSEPVTMGVTKKSIADLTLVFGKPKGRA